MSPVKGRARAQLYTLSLQSGSLPIPIVNHMLHGAPR